MLDLARVNPSLKSFHGGFTDGVYGYLMPFKNDEGSHGNVARIELSRFRPSGVTSINLSEVSPNLKGFVGGFTDGAYGCAVRPLSRASRGQRRGPAYPTPST